MEVISKIKDGGWSIDTFREGRLVVTERIGVSRHNIDCNEAILNYVDERCKAIEDKLNYLVLKMVENIKEPENKEK